MQGCYEHACDGKAADVVDEYIQMDRTCIEAMANKMLRIGKKYWQLERQEVFQVCLVQSIACIGTGKTTRQVCAGSIKVAPKRPPLYLKQWHQRTCGFGMLSFFGMSGSHNDINVLQ